MKSLMFIKPTRVDAGFTKKCLQLRLLCDERLKARQRTLEHCTLTSVSLCRCDVTSRVANSKRSTSRKSTHIQYGCETRKIQTNVLPENKTKQHLLTGIQFECDNFLRNKISKTTNLSLRRSISTSHRHGAVSAYYTNEGCPAGFGRTAHQGERGCPFRHGNTQKEAHSSEVLPITAVPGPTPLPYVGTMYKYAPPFGEYSDKDCIIRDSKKLRKYGEIVREEIFPGITLLHLFHPDDMEKVYRNNGRFPARGLVNALAKYRQEKDLPPDMINAQGEEWRRLRAPAQKHLSNTRTVAAYVPVQDTICDDLIRVIRETRGEDNSVQDTSKELNKWALECIGTLMYDTRMGVMQTELPQNSFAEETFRNLMVAFDAIYKCIFFWPLHKSGKTKMWKEFVRTMDYFRETSKTLTGKCVDKHKSGGDGLVDPSLNLPLSIINDPNISSLEVLDVQTSLLMGGIDTTSYSTLFALYHLATNPDKQEILNKELLELNPGKEGATPEMLAQAKYLKAVIKENFRLNPVFPFVARLLTDDIVIRGYKIPAGTRVLNHHGVASRRSDFVTDPDQFKPERWLRDNSPNGLRHKFAFMPFGFGPRMCIGKRYAEQELMLVLAKLIQNFRIEYDGPPLKFHSKLLYCPAQKMRFRFLDRETL